MPAIQKESQYFRVNVVGKYQLGKTEVCNYSLIKFIFNKDIYR